MNVHAAVAECVDIVLAQVDRATVDDIVSCAWDRHGEVLTEHGQHLVWQQVRNVVKQVMRERSEDDDTDDPTQQTIPGLGLPSAIAIPVGNNSYEYVRSDKATWEDLVAGRITREQNIVRAQRQLDRYDRALDTLRQYMEGTTLTTAEAFARRQSA
jgi:hypothetical protein